MTLETWAQGSGESTSVESRVCLTRVTEDCKGKVVRKALIWRWACFMQMNNLEFSTFMLKVKPKKGKFCHHLLTLKLQPCMSNTMEDILKNDCNFGTNDFHFIAKQLFGSNRSSKYLPLCSTEERNSHRFATTWGWVNDYRIVIFWWSIPLRTCCELAGEVSWACKCKITYTIISEWICYFLSNFILSFTQIIKM